MDTEIKHENCGGTLVFQYNVQSPEVSDGIVHPHYKCDKCHEMLQVYTFRRKIKTKNE